MSFLERFITSLEKQENTGRLCNPYQLPHRSDNLGLYLEALFEQPGRRVLVVGEALGYRGGLHTGIPFSSARLVHESSHPFWRRLRPMLTVDSKVSEATASIVWQYLERRRRIPLFWNALPFHPHATGKPDSNRAPSAAELRKGTEYLHTLATAYRADLIAGVGGKGFTAAQRAFPDRKILSLRHPSYGGKQAFCNGMDRLLG